MVGAKKASMMGVIVPIAPHVDSGDGGPCCDLCICTLSIPPQCQCTDVKSYCHPSCKSCRCTDSIPPQCRCLDIKDYCDKPCTTTGFVN